MGGLQHIGQPDWSGLSWLPSTPDRNWTMPIAAWVLLVGVVAVAPGPVAEHGLEHGHTPPRIRGAFALISVWLLVAGLHPRAVAAQSSSIADNFLYRADLQTTTLSLWRGIRRSGDIVVQPDFAIGMRDGLQSLSIGTWLRSESHTRTITGSWWLCSYWRGR